MKQLQVMTISLIVGAAGFVSVPLARAEDSVTYEVVSDQGLIPAANVEFQEGSQRVGLQEVTLPWRNTVTVKSAKSVTGGAEIRVDWRRYRWRYKWVTVRIYSGNKVLCESTLDVGDATCYGSTPHTPCAAGGPVVETPDCSYIPYPR
jgi:hypothetical protein